jgi:hypothetical protein
MQLTGKQQSCYSEGISGTVSLSRQPGSELVKCQAKSSQVNCQLIQGTMRGQFTCLRDRTDPSHWERRSPSDALETPSNLRGPVRIESCPTLNRILIQALITSFCKIHVYVRLQSEPWSSIWSGRQTSSLRTEHSNAFPKPIHGSKHQRTIGPKNKHRLITHTAGFIYHLNDILMTNVNY